MRFMVQVRADKKTEAGVMPSEKMLTDMGKYNEELMKAGVLLAGKGLHPSSKGARVKFELTPELREAEQRMRAQIERSKG